MDLIQVDQEKCIKCGHCAQVCPVGVIGMGQYGPMVSGQHCIACGHCVAICPTEALDNVHSPLAGQPPLEKMPVWDADAAARFLRSRRSVRAYQKTAVSREKIRQLLDIARFAPTASNSQGVAYRVIDHSDTLRSITAAVIDWVEKALKTPPWAGSSYEAPLTAQIASFRQSGKDVILRDAPCLVVAMADKSFLPTGRDNAHFSLSYAELYASSIGLGTCWAGFVEACAVANYQPLLDLLNLPENMSVTGAVMVGYPQYAYKRLVDRKPLQIVWQ
ncbi:nitroreductase family protein [Acetonema longum]|uniref:4Fe-4S ferredoxin iron-sulfur binding domain-containing protein n=1 Tax=Acetonema longum DSM 6540 TaxID=1009370 RepID=F7NDZ1_9FIRM|nr:nitroreductase family protein [Acetonema longum]EGO65745.1 4Fe-4S ferredoxin iron-sulfur binding domain-containing protein [Acetonema longum DSM 6540]